METLLRRAAATSVPMGSLVKLLIAFAMMVPLESVHPLQSGVLRLKHPSERRPGLPRERVWMFWPRFLWQAAYKHVVLAGMIARLLVLKASIARDPDARAYVDSVLGLRTEIWAFYGRFAAPTRRIIRALCAPFLLGLLTRTTGSRAYPADA